MSHAVSTWAWRQETTSPAQKLVLVKLADSANDDGVCWPSLRTLQRDLGMGKSSVDRHVKNLAEVGLLSVEVRKHSDGRRRSNLYRLAVPTLSHPDGTTSEDRCPTQTGQPLSHPERDIEPSVEPEPSKNLERRKPRARNPMFDELALACGLNLDAMTKEASRLCGIAASEITKAGGTPDMVKAAVRNYRAKFVGAASTPKAIANHWPEIVGKSLVEQRVCIECGIGGGYHLEGCSQHFASVRLPD